MPGIFSRLKTWVAGEVLTHSDLNAEFDNIISNAAGDKLDGTSHNLAEMQQTEDPAPSGTPDLVQPISITDEIRRLRYAVKRIVGKTNWYEAPDRSLKSVFSNARHIFSPSIDYDSDLSGAGIGEIISAGIYDSLGFNNLDFKSSTNTKFSAYALQNPITSPRYFYLDSGRLAGASNSYSFWFRNFAAGDTLLFNPVLGLRVYLNLSGYIQADLTLKTTTGSNKDIQSIVGTTSLAGGTSFKHLLLTYKVGGSSSDSFSLYIDGTLIGSINTPLSVNVGHKNERMFLMGSNSSRTSLKTYNANVIPDSDGWSLFQSGGTSSVSGGILTLDTTTGSNRYYTYTDSARSSPTWYEFKFKLPKITSYSSTPVATKSSYLDFFARTSGDGKGWHLSVTPDLIVMGQGTDLVFSGTSLEIPHNCSEWTVITVQQTTTTTSLYVNGVLKVTALTKADSTAGTVFGFGKTESAAYGVSGIQIEYVKYGSGSGVISPNTVNTQQISDFVSFRGVLSDQTSISALQSSSPFSLYGLEVDTKQREVNCVSMYAPVTSTTGSAVDIVGSSGTPVCYPIRFFSDGKTPITVMATVNGATSFSASVSNHYHSLYFRFEGNGIFTSVAGQPTQGFGGTSNLASSVPRATLRLGSVPANQIFPVSMTIIYSHVFPPGENTGSLVLYSDGTAGSNSMVANQTTISIT